MRASRLRRRIYDGDEDHGSVLQEKAADAAQGGTGVRLSRGGDARRDRKRGCGRARRQPVAPPRRRAAARALLARRRGQRSRSIAARRARAAGPRKAPRDREGRPRMIDLRYALHGGAIALVWFGMINVAAAAVVLLVAHRAGRRAAASGPTFWLSLRLLPAVASIAFVGLLFVPSYWAYEPRAVEDLDVTLAIAACATLVLFVAAATRASGAWHRSARRGRMRLRAARPLDVGSAIPTYEAPIEAPMMALVGVFRPRLVVTRGVVDALTADELRAAVAHEIGHLRAADNLKRLAIAAAPDVIGLARAGSAIETRW